MKKRKFVESKKANFKRDYNKYTVEDLSQFTYLISLLLYVFNETI